jgi:hypothetical protein
MKRNSVFVLVLTLFVMLASADSAGRDAKPGERAVFLSAKELADACRDWIQTLAANGLHEGEPVDDNRILVMTRKQMAGSIRCHAYIDGIYDEVFEDVSKRPGHYRPVKGAVDSEIILVETFIKYVADHPEEGDLAGATVLREASEIVEKAQTAPKK